MCDNVTTIIFRRSFLKHVFAGQEHPDINSELVCCRIQTFDCVLYLLCFVMWKFSCRTQM